MSTNIAAPKGWEKVERQVLERLSGRDPATTAALREWRSRIEKVRRLNASAEISHVLSSEGMLKAVARFFIADLEEDKASFRARLARQKLLVAQARMLEAITEHEGILAETEGQEEIVPECLAVIRHHKSASHTRRMRLINASREIATNNKDVMGEHPSPLDDEVPDFKSDLLDFIKANGEAGRQAVVRTCDERDYAERLIADKSTPKPLRFLAGLVLEDDALQLPDAGPQHAFGFAAGR